MYTYQMVGLADQNGRTYVSKYGTYDKEKGFVVYPQYDYLKSRIVYQDLINNLFHDDCWMLEKPKPKKMTKEEIEKELGYEIEICDPAIKNERIVSILDLLKEGV